MKNNFEHAKLWLSWMLMLAGGLAAIQPSFAWAPPGLQTLPNTLPSGVAGFGYNVTLSASGGTAPYTWGLQAGSTLPSGFQFSVGGVLSGTPASTGSYDVAVQVTDSAGKQANQSYTLSISNSGITTTSLPSGVTGIAYGATLSATGGTAPYSWSAANGHLPAGLSLSSLGALSGTPSVLGYNAFTVKAADSKGQRFSQPLSINTVSPLNFSGSALPPGMLGRSYLASLGASGGSLPYTWKLVSGAPPPVLGVDTTGTVAGMPAAIGSYGFTVQVSDGSGQQANGPVSLAIDAPVAIATTSLPNGMVATAYNVAVSASGGIAPYIWSLAAGSLPAGLSLTTTGAVSGTPTAQGSSTFTLQVTDSSGGTSSQAYTVSIAPALSITTTSLPNGTIGAAYSAMLAATGGTSPYSWSIASGLLPAGVGLGASTGTISGTPSTAGTYNITMQIADSSGRTALKTLSLVIVAALSITAKNIPDGAVGVVYNATFAASGGTSPYTWSVSSGGLPAGLSLSSAGTISGIPTAQGSSTFTLQVTDSSGGTSSQAYTVSIAPGFSITTTSLPSGTVGTPYSATVSATGGASPYTWSVSAGTLPAGLSLSAGGLISGTPTAAGSANFTLQATDSTGVKASQAFTVSVVSGLAITTNSLPNGATGAAYSATLSATGGAAPYSWSIASGLLPTGVSLGTTTGIISGTPLTAGTYNVMVQASDISGQRASASLNLAVLATLVITSSCPPSGTVGVAYSATLSASGGVSPILWVLTSGQLPGGLNLSQAGTVSGTPSATGSFNFVIGASDSTGANATQACTTGVSSVLSSSITIMNADLPNGTVGSSYSSTLSAKGGTLPYTWSVVSGALPAGLTLNSSTGLISGNPTAVGWSNMFAIQVQDSVGNSGSLPYSIIMNPVLDLYGGLTGQSCNGNATGYFYTQKIANRWWLCDPLNKRFFLNGLGAMTLGGGNYTSLVTAKYGDLYTWASQQNRRAQLWGFNTVGELSDEKTWPNSTCSGCSWAGGAQPVKMPYMPDIGGMSGYAAGNVYGYANGPVKDIIYGTNTHYNAWRGAGLLDFFDPNHKQWVNGDLTNDTAWMPSENNPYNVGWLIDDIDWAYGFGAGPDFKTIGADQGGNAHNNANIGFMALITSPMQTFDPRPANFASPQLYADSKVYSKVAMASPPSTCDLVTPCSVRDYLYKKYNGNIASLNNSWGSNYTTFDSSGVQVTETIGTGDGSTASFSHTAAHAPMSPLSVSVSVGGTVQAGDCPWWFGRCLTNITNTGILMGGSTTTLPSAQPDQYVLVLQNCSCSLPAAYYWAKVMFHYSKLTPSYASVEVSTIASAGQRVMVYSPDNPDPAASGYDVYVSTRPIGDTSGIGQETLQASNIPFGTNWTEPNTGIITGSPVPGVPTSINYSSGQITVTLAVPPAVGAAVTVTYTYHGWASGGTGLMDEDGSNSWVGTNNYCLIPATACDGSYLPAANAQANVGADMDAWVAQFAANYFKNMRSIVKMHSANNLYLGADTLGSWYVPPHRGILQACALYCDAAFVALPNNQAMLDFTVQYLGDMPMINFLDFSANPDSALGGHGIVGEDFATQPLRGQFLANLMNFMLNNQTTSTASYPWVGSVWWGLTDFLNEGIAWGLVSLSDNPYDGKAACQATATDAWGYSTGGETATSTCFGDMTDYIKRGNALWQILH